MRSCGRPRRGVAQGLGGLAFGRGLGDLVADIEWQRLVGGQALPVYLRDKVAQTTAEREAAKALRDAAAGAAP